MRARGVRRECYTFTTPTLSAGLASRRAYSYQGVNQGVKRSYWCADRTGQDCCGPSLNAAMIPCLWAYPVHAVLVCVHFDVAIEQACVTLPVAINLEHLDVERVGVSCPKSINENGLRKRL